VLTALLVVTSMVAMTALYVAAEFAAVSVRRSRIRQMAEDGDATAVRLLPILEDASALDRYIAACQVGITLGSLILGAYGQIAFGPPLAGLIQQGAGLDPIAASSAAAVVILLVLTVGTMVAGELAPKSLALEYPTQIALYTYWPMRWSLWLLGPFIWFLNGSGTLVLRLLGSAHGAHRHVHSPEEIELLIAESHDGGLLEPDELRRLQRALRFLDGSDRDVDSMSDAAALQRVVDHFQQFGDIYAGNFIAAVPEPAGIIVIGAAVVASLLRRRLRR